MGMKEVKNETKGAKGRELKKKREKGGRGKSRSDTLLGTGVALLLALLEVTGLASDLASLLGEDVGRTPLGGVTRSGLREHLVDLLKSEALGLGHEENGINERSRAEGTPDEL
jgi:hypothetical protein